MSNLTELFPPLELCKLIPEGAFEDSVHWYRWSYIDQKYLLDAGKPDVRLYREPCPCGMKYLYPAPTLQEILEVLPHDDAYNTLILSWSEKIEKFTGWHIYYIGDRKRHCYDQSAVTAALKLYLKQSETSDK